MLCTGSNLECDMVYSRVVDCICLYVIKISSVGISSPSSLIFFFFFLSLPRLVDLDFDMIRGKRGNQMKIDTLCTH